MTQEAAPLHDALALGLRRRVPLVLQTEAAECGLACLAMVLGYHGVHTDLATLRSRYPVSLMGMTLASLSAAAEREHLGFRAVRLEMTEIAQLRLPAILHWDLSHFVVLKSASGGRITVNDPHQGERSYTIEEASPHFTGVALEVWPDAGFQPRDEKRRISISHMLGQVTGLRTSLAQVLLLSGALQVFVLLSPLLLQWVVDQVVVSHDANLLATLAIGFVLLLVLQQCTSLLRSWLLMAFNTSLRVQWRANVFSHLLRLPLEYFQKRHLGDILSRTAAADEIQRVLTSAFVEGVLDGVLVLVTLVLMFIYSPLLAGVALLAVALYLGLRLAWFRPLYVATEEQIVRGAQVASHSLETIRGIRAIRLFARQVERRNTWQSLMVEETNAGIAIQKLRIGYTFARSSLSGLTQIGLLTLGALQVMSGQLTVGMLMAFLAYRTQFESRVTSLIDLAMDLKMLQLQAERLADVVLTPPQLTTRRSLVEGRPASPPELRVENLRFRYAEHEPWVLDGVSFTVRSGESLAIVGASGCGKTTLANVLLGVLKPVEGTLQRDGLPLDPAADETWHSMLGTVQQDDTLFAGSIAENIAFFDPRPDAARIEECARIAAVHDEIVRMPMGYRTLVGDMGTVLSGGQKQRVLLARALYKAPLVLVLDEATSHLDSRSETAVNEALAKVKATRIMVVHSREALLTAHRVIEIERGRIAFEGPAAAYLAREQRPLSAVV